MNLNSDGTITEGNRILAWIEENGTMHLYGDEYRQRVTDFLPKAIASIMDHDERSRLASAVWAPRD